MQRPRRGDGKRRNKGQGLPEARAEGMAKPCLSRFALKRRFAGRIAPAATTQGTHTLPH